MDSVSMGTMAGFPSAADMEPGELGPTRVPGIVSSALRIGALPAKADTGRKNAIKNSVISFRVCLVTSAA
ncbi:MAG: hypothetical protein A3J79_04870 [Elusimicrobia bacterium RIFOXYB2_FULL_62_6]|nr:MAG: hypothetical protein A3J79_04870 [Elusimicrobia bacterium RIFOXYB2_FULL_62_6]